jgi:hypothetical protein
MWRANGMASSVAQINPKDFFMWRDLKEHIIQSLP